MSATYIPKIIHYCWFGRNPLPESAIKCINSWKKFFPDYKIKEWNEDNFDVNIIPYTHDAYEAKKYAFVSDYARFWILYHEGGVYFDTDVEVIKPFDDIIKKGAFMGLESNGHDQYIKLSINPGLGLGACAKLDIYREILNHFHQMSFYNEDHTFNNYSMIPMVTELFLKEGLKAIGNVELIRGIYIYPQDYFNPFDDLTGKLNITIRTHSIHWYSKSWCDVNSTHIWLSRMVHRIFGLKINRIKKLLNRL